MKPRLLFIVFALGIIFSLAALAYSSGLFASEHVLTKDGINLRIFGGKGQTAKKRTQDWLRKQVMKYIAIREMGWHELRTTTGQLDSIPWIFFDITGIKGFGWYDKHDTWIWSEISYKGEYKKITRRFHNGSRFYFECSPYFLACVELEIKAARDRKNHTFKGTLNKPKEKYPGKLDMLACEGMADPDFVEYGKRCEKCGRKTIFFLCECGGSHCLHHWPKLIDLPEQGEPQTSLPMYYFKDFFEWLGE